MRNRTSISLGLLGAILLASVFATTWTATGASTELGQTDEDLPNRIRAEIDGEAINLDVDLPPKTGNRKLASGLNKLVDALAVYGQLGVRVVADRMAVSTEAGSIRVVVETLPGRADDVTQLAKELEVPVEAVYENLVQLLAPVTLLETLAGADSVMLIRLPFESVPLGSVTGEGVSLIGADSWHAAGFTGAGVKVAILDLGFEGYTSLLGSELPASVVTHSCRSGGITAGGVHGTAVAEIVYESAPNAQLYLVNIQTFVEFGNCVDWLKGQGIDIVNFSAGFTGSGPGDGTGAVNDIVSAAKSQGILWVNSAGNEAQQHWAGPWIDGDGDDFLNFSVTDETNQINAFAGEVISVVLKWDDPFGTSCNDYDLQLRDASLSLVATSLDFQDFCTSGISRFPVEFIEYVAPSTGAYHVVVTRFNADGSANFHLYSQNDFHSCANGGLQYCVKAGSIIEPGDNPGALTVGAVAWDSPSAIEVFSSRGPTEDGRTKPDLVAPDGVSNATFGQFFGTSASAPHAAGAAALVKQWQPGWSQSEIRSFLTSEAVDLGPSGLDDTYGAGRLDLGAPKTAPPPTGVVPTPQPTATPPSSTTVSVSSANTSVGETATAWLRVLNVSPPGLGAWIVNIQYDPAVLSVAGCAPEHGSVCNPAFQPNKVRLVGATAIGLPGDVTLAFVGFTCLRAGTSGLIIEVEQLADAVVGDPQLIAADTLNGSVSCKIGLLGDANCSGIINAVDALVVLQFLAGLLVSLPCAHNADVDLTGGINPIDALIILQFDGGLIDTLPP